MSTRQDQNDRAMSLSERADWVWLETLRLNRAAPETRIASSLSAVGIFTALYYGGVLRFDPGRPYWEDRDRCIISKGHGSICMYPILADLGFFDKEELNRVCKAGGILGGIPDPVIPGYETINGSLGHGLGVGAGIALALKRKGSDRNVFVVVGDGELHEGANWEAIMFASQHKLDNLHVIVDDNSICMLGYTKDVVSHGELAQRFESFGWAADSADGHDVEAVVSALSAMTKMRDGHPKVLIAKTVKGYRVPGLENAPLCHVMNPPSEVLDSIIKGQQ